ncbi:MAG TPA: polysaccharide biosynthesis tyrosine autokinase [bacterium]|nr:polysaccharide biosynthesis tyrosine autokinase [bacterium]
MEEQQLTLQDYLAILGRGKWLIMLSFLAVMAATVYVTFTTPPTYEASALIMLKQDGGVQSRILDIPGYLKRDTMINNHVEILKSRSLAREVIRRLEETAYADTLGVLGNGPKASRFSPSGWVKGLFGSAGGRGGPAEQDAALKRFADMIAVMPRRDTDLIQLKVEAGSPLEARLVANTWMEAYQDQDMEASRGEVSEVRSFLENKLGDVQSSLARSEDNLRDYQQTSGVAELNTETQQMITQLAGFESEYQAATTQLEANQRRLNFLKTQLDESQRAMIEGANLTSPVIAELQKQLAQLIGEMASYQQQLRGAGYATESDPKLTNMNSRIQGLQERIAEETRRLATSGAAARNPLAFSESLLGSILTIETENKSLTAKVEALERIVAQYNAGLDALPEKSLRLARLQREAEVNNKIFLMLREKYEESRIVEAGQAGSVRIVDYADPPEIPVRPKKKMNLMLGLMIGLGLGAGLTFLREYLDTSIRTAEELERLGFTVLAGIPVIHQSGMRAYATHAGGNGVIHPRLITRLPNNSPVSEAYRALRTNVKYADLDNPFKTLLVTSPGPGDGKSTTATNLAITFAQLGARTLLIDADLRRPILHAYLSAKRGPGLTQILVGKVKPGQAIQKTGIKNLSFLPAGSLPRNPSEFLSSKVMGRLIERLSAAYDMILIDSPPVISVTDAAVLSTRVDGTILVVRAGKTDREALILARQQLEKVKGRICGVGINGITQSRKYGHYYDYYTKSA